MTIIVKEVIIPNSDHMHIEVKLPAGLPAGEAVMTVIFEPKKTMTRR